MNDRPLGEQMGIDIHNAQRVPLSQINIRCNWHAVPDLAERISRFLRSQHPTTRVVSRGMAKRGETKMVFNAEHTLEGFLILADASQDLHGGAVERFVESLVTEGVASDYVVFTVPLKLVIDE